MTWSDRFHNPLSFAVGKNPNGLVVADFNGDGHTDIAEVDYSGVNVLIGNGDGSFLPAHNHSATEMFISDPSHLAMGDFDGDGILDLAVADHGGYVSVLRGMGDGTFQPIGWFDAGHSPSYVATGDVNRDGTLDLVVTLYSGGVSVLLGNGDGTFQPPMEYAAGLGPQSVAIGDLTGDGWPDLVVANEGRAYFPEPIHEEGTMSVLLNRGDGTFAPATHFRTGWSPLHIGLADINHDGHLDAIVANHGNTDHGNTESGTISVLHGNGDGIFRTPIDTSVSAGPFSFAIVDIDDNGMLDLIVVGGTQACSVLIGDGSGAFAESATYSVGNVPIAVAVADFNGDGFPDLAIANHGNRSVGVLLGRSEV